MSFLLWRVSVVAMLVSEDVAMALSATFCSASRMTCSTTRRRLVSGISAREGDDFEGVESVIDYDFDDDFLTSWQVHGPG